MKAVFLMQCSPSQLHSLHAKLAEEQAKTVVDMGFGGLLDLSCKSLNHILCLRLVKSFDLRRHVMVVKGHNIPVTYHDVGMALGLPDNGNFFLSIKPLWHYFFFPF